MTSGGGDNPNRRTLDLDTINIPPSVTTIMERLPSIVASSQKEAAFYRCQLSNRKNELRYSFLCTSCGITVVRRGVNKLSFFLGSLLLHPFYLLTEVGRLLNLELTLDPLIYVNIK